MTARESSTNLLTVTMKRTWRHIRHEGEIAVRADRLSIKARLQISIIALVATITLVLSFLHLDGVIGETLSDTSERATLIANHVKTYVIETTSRNTPPAPLPTLQAQKQFWYESVRKDPVLPHLLEKSLSNPTSVVEILVLDEHDRVLAASTSGRVGQVQSHERNLADWERLATWRQLWEVVQSDRDYAMGLPIGASGESRPVMSVQVLIAPALLRAAVFPKLGNLALVCFTALLMSILLAILVSKLFSRSIERIGESIEQIYKGHSDITGAGPTFETPEMVAVHSKLLTLGKEYSEIRNDIVNLRTNVDQVVANLEEAVLVFGPDGRLQIAGSPAERLLSRSRAELIGQTMSDLFPVWTGVGRLLQEATATGDSLRSRLTVLERPNLPATKLAATLEWLDYGDGRRGALLTLRDAETRQRIVSHLDVAQRLSSISRLMTGVAHEIKNPLNAIMVHLELALAKLSGSSTSSGEELNVIKRELLRLDRVLKTFLDFNRPVDLQWAECDLGELAREIAALLNPTAEQRGLHIEVENSAGRACISADFELLKQAVVNVVTNGLEATNRPGRLLVMVERQPDEVALSVKDQGSGIAPEIQDKIFNLYFTTKPAGNGIGLAVTYRVVQLHGGTISFESEVGKGTSFYLKFPVQQTTGVAA